MKTSLILIGVLVLLAGGIGAWVYLAPGVPVETAVVRRGEIREFIDEQAKTRLPRVHTISMPFAGRLEPIPWEAGQAIAAGEVAARIVAADMEIELAAAQAAVERIERRIAENDDATVETTAVAQARHFVESMVDTVAAAEARKTSGRKGLDFAESLFARTARLAETGARTQEELEQADLRRVQSSVDYQQDVLVYQAMQSILAATQLMPTMINQYIARKSLGTEVLRQELAEAQSRLREAQLRKQRSEMKSPIDGVVLERMVDSEQQLAAGAELLTIGRMSELEVEADVLTQEVGPVQLSDPVEIYGPAIGPSAEHFVEGQVARIYPAGFTKVSSLGVEQQRVKVIVNFQEGVQADLASRGRQLGVDYRVRVRIVTAAKPEALIVPRSAIFRGSQGNWQVFAVRRGRAALVEVETGLMNDRHIEVTSGLTEGEQVVLAPESNLMEGDKVAPSVSD